MPFADPKLGEFRIAGRFADTTFAYVPRSIAPADSLPWPELTQMSGELVFDRLSLQVKDASGRLAGLAGQGPGAGLQISRAEALIPDLLHATVNVTADARGGLGGMLETVNGSPLGALTGSALAQVTATGTADLRLKLALPVAAFDKTSVQGSVILTNSDVQWSPTTPRLSRARGTVSFTEAGFAIAGGQAKEEIEIDYGGDTIEIGFNVTYLIDALMNMSQEMIKLELQDTNSSALITVPEQAGFKYVVMPMRI